MPLSDNPIEAATFSRATIEQLVPIVADTVQESALIDTALQTEKTGADVAAKGLLERPSRTVAPSPASQPSPSNRYEESESQELVDLPLPTVPSFEQAVSDTPLILESSAVQAYSSLSPMAENGLPDWTFSPELTTLPPPKYESRPTELLDEDWVTEKMSILAELVPESTLEVNAVNTVLPPSMEPVIAALEPLEDSAEGASIASRWAELTSDQQQETSIAMQALLIMAQRLQEISSDTSNTVQEEKEALGQLMRELYLQVATMLDLPTDDEAAKQYIHRVMEQLQAVGETQGEKQRTLEDDMHEIKLGAYGTLLQDATGALAQHLQLLKLGYFTVRASIV